jgi:hypothetical protein
MRNVGYFTNEDHEVPDYDPGLNVPCEICGRPLCHPIKTISLMPNHNRAASYFYRVHKDCYESLPEREVALLESEVIDGLAGGMRTRTAE